MCMAQIQKQATTYANILYLCQEISNSIEKQCPQYMGTSQNAAMTLDMIQKNNIKQR